MKYLVLLLVFLLAACGDSRSNNDSIQYVNAKTGMQAWEVSSLLLESCSAAHNQLCAAIALVSAAPEPSYPFTDTHNLAAFTIFDPAKSNPNDGFRIRYNSDIFPDKQDGEACITVENANELLAPYYSK